MAKKPTTKKTTPKKDTTFVFEPVTDRQLEKIWAEAAISGMPDAAVREIIEKLTGLELETALSKQEADYLIKRIMGPRSKVGLLEPWKPKRASRLDYDTSNLPRLTHIRDIREFMVYLGWKPWKIKAYLQQKRKVSTIRDLDREGARKTHWHLQQMVTRKAPMWNPPTMQPRRGAR